MTSVSDPFSWVRSSRRRASLVCAILLISIVATAGIVKMPQVTASHLPLPGEVRSIQIRIDRVEVVHHAAITSSCLVGTSTDFCGVLDPGPGEVITIVDLGGAPFDLLELQSGLVAGLGISEEDLPERLVTQFRLVLQSAIIVVDGFQLALFVPGGVIKFDGVFEKSKDEDVIFDFDPEKSLILTRGTGFMLKGVIDFCTVPSGCPDLIVESLTHSPENPTTTDTITFTAVVKNSGLATSGKSMLNFRIGGETIGENFPVPYLLPNGFVTVQRQLVLDVAQNYQNTATADADDEVEETDEGNNVTIDLYAVTQA